MTLQEAISSGRCFRQEGETGWYASDRLDEYQWTHWQVMANNWVIEEEQITITESKFRKAWESMSKTKYYDDQISAPRYDVWKYLKEISK